MTHRERVLSAITHNKVDRVPFDFWAEPPALERLYTFVGTKNIDNILKDFEVDIRHIEAIMPPEKNYGSFFQNFLGERYVYQETKWVSIFICSSVYKNY